jgi:hypothetical protein
VPYHSSWTKFCIFYLISHVCLYYFDLHPERTVVCGHLAVQLLAHWAIGSVQESAVATPGNKRIALVSLLMQAAAARAHHFHLADQLLFHWQLAVVQCHRAECSARPCAVLCGHGRLRHVHGPDTAHLAWTCLRGVRTLTAYDGCLIASLANWQCCRIGSGILAFICDDTTIICGRWRMDFVELRGGARKQYAAMGCTAMAHTLASLYLVAFLIPSQWPCWC